MENYSTLQKEQAIASFSNMDELFKNVTVKGKRWKQNVQTLFFNLYKVLKEA